MLTGSQIEAVWIVNPITGSVFWRNGKEAGAICFDGYRQLTLNYRRYKAHHVVWAWVHGRWPKGEIDHINGIRADNRPANLRECSVQQNRLNGGLRSNNKSGFKWVCWDKRAARWRADVKAARYCRLYDDPMEAHLAARAIAERVHGEFFNDGSRNAFWRAT